MLMIHHSYLRGTEYHLTANERIVFGRRHTPVADFSLYLRMYSRRETRSLFIRVEHDQRKRHASPSSALLEYQNVQFGSIAVHVQLSSRANIVRLGDAKRVDGVQDVAERPYSNHLRRGSSVLLGVDEPLLFALELVRLHGGERREKVADRIGTDQCL